MPLMGHFPTIGQVNESSLFVRWRVEWKLVKSWSFSFLVRHSHLIYEVHQQWHDERCVILPVISHGSFLFSHLIAAIYRFILRATMNPCHGHRLPQVLEVNNS